MVISEFNPLTDILEAKFEGHVNLEEILDYIISTKNNKDFPRDLKIITDASQASFNFSYNGLQSIVSENKKSLKQYSSITDAIIVTNPKTTALSILYQELEKTKKYKFNIFSTKEAAMDWLNDF